MCSSSATAPAHPVEPDLTAVLAPTSAVEAHLVAFLDGRPLPANLRQAMRYALLGPGKRLRPLLVIHACQAVGGTLAQALPAAAAIEMIHAFSLVHDDLPALDNDDLRRGRPTLHKHANEPMAILAGDGLMGLAFELVTAQVHPAELAARILGELATATNDMIAGQVYDTLPDFPADIDPLLRLQTIHRNKTGALIRCSCRMGALLGNAQPQQLQALTRYGEVIGLMFQVVDDLLDVTQSTAQLGKAAQKDAQAGKTTYPGIIGIDATRLEIKRLHQESLAALEGLGEKAQALRQLCNFMAVRQK